MNPKMDQISVPLIQEDAMENWGLLTFVYMFTRLGLPFSITSCMQILA